MTKFVSQTTPVRSFDSREFPLADLVARKRDRDVRIAACLPARDEETTVGDVVASIPDELVDEIVVVDDGSTDRTAVVAAAPALASSARRAGRGPPCAAASSRTTATSCVPRRRRAQFEQHFVTGLVGPLLVHDDLALVKGFYLRPTADGPRAAAGHRDGRQLLGWCFPSSPTYASRWPRGAPGAACSRSSTCEGYAVDLALLLDAVSVAGSSQWPRSTSARGSTATVLAHWRTKPKPSRDGARARSRNSRGRPSRPRRVVSAMAASRPTHRQ